MKTYNKHGMTRSSEFHSWNHMKDRCLNPNNQNYAQYGGRGITVHPSWVDSFPQFLADMGRKPTRFHTIERIDNLGNYEPSNCRWATMAEQNHNKSNAKLHTLNGITKSETQWANDLGINVKTIRSRLRYGWSLERALTNKE